MGFEWKGRIYTWEVGAFGISSACYMYTMIKQEIFRPLRDLRVKLMFFIDDKLQCESSRPRARLQSEALLKALVKIGTTISLDKSMMLPGTRAKFLGLEVDVLEGKFGVPIEKQVTTTALMRRVIEAPQVSNRDMARVAGKMISLSLAIPPASLTARALYKAMVGLEGWDKLYPSPCHMKADLEPFMDLLENSNRSRMFKRRVSVVVAGDASEVANVCGLHAQWRPGRPHSHFFH